MKSSATSVAVKRPWRLRISRNAVVEIISSLLILLFMYAAVSKLSTLKASYFKMDGQPFPNWMTPYLIWGTCLSEIAISVLLFFDRTKKVGLWSFLGLMGAFTIYIAIILLGTFEKVPCSCGGVIEELGWTNHLYFNLFFMLLSVISLLMLRKQRSENKSSSPA